MPPAFLGGKGQRLCFRLALLPVPIRLAIYNSVWMGSSRRRTEELGPGWIFLGHRRAFAAGQRLHTAAYCMLALQSRHSSRNCNIIIVDIKGFRNLHCLFCRPALPLSSTRPRPPYKYVIIISRYNVICVCAQKYFLVSIV